MMKSGKAAALVALLSAFVATGCGFLDTGDDDRERPSLRVDDQVADPANRIVVAEAVSEVLGWVVIHEDEDGSAGEVVGFAQVQAGTNRDLVVQLDRDARHGETLHAMLHVDEGERGELELSGPDVPVRDADGRTVEDSFTVTLREDPDRRLIVEDQIADPADRIVVAYVLSERDGWVLIHEDEDGAPGEAIGYVGIPEGESVDLLVQLDRGANDDERLHAVLHVDAGALWELELPEPDVMVTDQQGNPVTDTFVVSLAEASPAIRVEDQVAAPPNEVLIAQVSSDGPGFVVIHEDDRGAPGTVIGLARVAHGTTPEIRIGLEREVDDGETLHAMLHVDRGELGELEFPGPDVPVEDASGRPVAASFVVTRPRPTIRVADQSLDNLSTMVLVAEVTSVWPGWLVVHADRSGAPGRVLGAVQVAAGPTEESIVVLDRPAVDGETLHVMLHLDEGEHGVFEFPGADVPEVDERGDEIGGSFSVSVPEGTPAVRLSFEVGEPAAWQVPWVEPEQFLASVLGEGGDNPAISLRHDWRYELVNAGYPDHQLELVRTGGSPAGDGLLLSQAGEGSLEDDDEVAWFEEDAVVRFTVTTALARDLNGYRCAEHPAEMRGSVRIDD